MLRARSTSFGTNGGDFRAVDSAGWLDALGAGEAFAWHLVSAGVVDAIHSDQEQDGSDRQHQGHCPVGLFRRGIFWAILLPFSPALAVIRSSDRAHRYAFFRVSHDAHLQR